MPSRNSCHRRHHRAAPPRFDSLESRRLLTTYVVNTPDDVTDDADNLLSLREAVNLANNHAGPDVVSFAPALSGATVKLTNDQLDLTDDLTIAPAGSPAAPTPAPHVKIDADTDNRIFNIAQDVKVTVADLDLLNGHGPIEGDGGTIYNLGDLTLRRVLISGSHAGNAFASFDDFGTPGGNGGAIYNRGNLTVRDSAILDNSAGFAADGIDEFDFGGSGGDGGDGGGIYNDADGTLTLINTTLENNDAGRAGNGGASLFGFGDGGPGGNGGSGGGLYNAGAATLIHCTLSDNFTGAGGIGGDPGGRFGFQGSGGGVFNEDNASLTIANSISADNDPGLDTPDVAGPVTSLGHNLIGDKADSTGWLASDQTGNFITPIDPKFGAIGYHGGPTPTLPLLAGSPAIDKADASLNTAAGVPTDARGYVRSFGAAADVGAFEFNSAFPGDATHDDKVDFNDLVALAQNYNTNASTWEKGDFNFDHKVDFNDLVILAQNYNTSLYSAPPPAPAATLTAATLKSNPLFAPLTARDTKPLTAITTFSTKPITKPTPPKTPPKRH